MKRHYSTKDAAQELGIHPSRVRVLIKEGRLRARKLGRDWLILPGAIDAVRDRKPGRPPKKGEGK